MFIRYLLGALWLLAVPLYAPAQGTIYNVSWPAIHLDGTFTLSVGSAFGTYNSTQASGTYGGVNGTYETIWTQVSLSAQPDLTQLTFSWDQGYTGYAVSP